MDFRRKYINLAELMLFTRAWMLKSDLKLHAEILNNYTIFIRNIYFKSSWRNTAGIVEGNWMSIGERIDNLYSELFLDTSKTKDLETFIAGAVCAAELRCRIFSLGYENYCVAIRRFGQLG